MFLFEGADRRNEQERIRNENRLPSRAVTYAKIPGPALRTSATL